MLITFIPGPEDSILMIRALNQIGNWLIEHKGVEVVFYLPDLSIFSLLPHNLVKLRWLRNELQPEGIPGSDIIISTQPEQLRSLNGLNRGELIYLKKNNRDNYTLPEDIKVVDLTVLKPGIPPEFFKINGRKRNKIIIAGEIGRSDLNQLFIAFEKIVPTLFPAEIIILDSPENFRLDTILDYSYLKTDKQELKDLLSESFYLIYLRREDFPLLPIWAMAAGVIVIGISLNNDSQFFPFELKDLDPVELAFNMIRLFKLGEFRFEIKNRADKMVEQYELNQVGEQWYNLLKKILKYLPDSKEVSDRIEKGLVDLIIINQNDFEFNRCLEGIKKHTKLPFHLIVVERYNQGILMGNGEYIVLLNCALEVTEGWLATLIKMAGEKEVAVVETGDRACYLIKRELIPVLGFFAEEYPLDYEKLDYSLRAQEKGYRVISSFENDKKYLNQAEKGFKGKWVEVIAGSDKRKEPDKIIIGGLIPWDFRKQRIQHLVRELADQGYQILYLEPICHNNFIWKAEENIYLYSLPGSGTILSNIKGGNISVLGKNISETIKNLNFVNSFLLLDAPFWTPLLKYLEYSVLAYDYKDNYPDFNDELLELADLVLTPSMSDYKRIKEKNENTYLLPNGVEIEHFNYLYRQAGRPDDLPDNQLIIGYCGEIVRQFDLDLITALARAIPEAALILIGEVSTDISKLTREKNIYLLGEKPYSSLPDYLACFKLAILPFKIKELTYEMVSVYEYLAAGIPVLATDLSELERFTGLIEFADNKEVFIRKARVMLMAYSDKSEKKAKFNKIKEESWQERARKLALMLHLAYYGLFLNDQEGTENPDRGYYYRLRKWFTEILSHFI